MSKNITLSVEGGKIITFNDQQVEALDKIGDWLVSDKHFFTLAGYAGTGKSTIIKKVFNDIRLRKSEICVSAPTHKAKKVVTRKSGQHGETLHSLLGLRPDVELDDFNPNNPKFGEIAPPRITDYKFLVVDEASMINRYLFKLIKDLVQGSKTKVLFMGDPAQIPPVGEEESVVFYDGTIEIFWLTKVERQSDSNPLMPFYDAIRNNLGDVYSGIVRKTTMNEKGEGIMFLNDRNAFRKIVIDKFTSKEFKNNSDFVKMIAWTNNAVIASNLLIRSAIFGDECEMVELDDILMGYRTISDRTMKFNIIENSADYRVVRRSGLEENHYGIRGYRLELCEEIDELLYDYRKIFLVDTTDYKNLHDYAEMHDKFRDQAVLNKKLWTKYYDFRRSTMINVDIKKYRDGSDRGKGSCIAKDLDYGYAQTCHKSQGSTYEHVFVLEDDINGNWMVNERNQIKYVAFTRPTTSAIVLSNWTEI